MKLDIGAGESSPEGYLRQDVDKTLKGLDIVCDIRELDKHVKPESCDVIRASHVMEHFATKEIPGLFKMIYKLLKPGGTFNIVVPDFRYHGALVLNKLDEQAVYYAYGGQLNEYDFHRTAFTTDILIKNLTEAGFVSFELILGTSIDAKAKK